MVSVVLPMFILMGALIHRAELAEDLYDAAYAFLGHLRGGLAHATVMACAMFAAISGSSIATAATMSKVALPPMARLGYKPGFGAGCVASAGTLGVLIPPSVPLIIYGIIAEQDIGKLFIAGIGPGLILAALFMLAIVVITAIKPELGPKGERTPFAARMKALSRVWVVLLLFLLVVGGLYTGLFTATEAAAMGAAGSLIFCWARGKLGWRGLFDALVDSAMTTTMIFAILFGALVFANFINFTGMAASLPTYVQSLGLGKYGVLFCDLPHLPRARLPDGDARHDAADRAGVHRRRAAARRRSHLVRRVRGRDGRDRHADAAGRHERVHGQGAQSAHSRSARSSPA